MHIVIADQLPASAVELLRSVPGWTIDARSGRSAEELARDLAHADALVVRSATKVTASVLSAAPQLKVIAREIGVKIWEGEPGDKPLALCQNALREARNTGHDVLIIDTAGRLHYAGGRRCR